MQTNKTLIYQRLGGYMPELPEVETVRRGLMRLVQGRQIKSVDIFWDKTLSGMPKNEVNTLLADKIITTIDRRGKYLLFRLTEKLTIVSHLRMEGSFYTVPFGTNYGKHDLVVFHLDHDIDLIYRDTRKFGRMKIVKNKDVMTVAGLATIGPEPTEETLTLDCMLDEFSHSRTRMKPFLLDQSHIAGLGNIYVDETLWQSKIHPLTKANQLTVAEISCLRENIISELSRATKHHGTTVHSFTNAYGEAGSFQNELQVYGRVGEPCLRCGTPLEKIKVAQRGTTFCPVCQIEKEA